jgi:hypothetical protein
MNLFFHYLVACFSISFLPAPFLLKIFFCFYFIFISNLSLSSCPQLFLLFLIYINSYVLILPSIFYFIFLVTFCIFFCSSSSAKKFLSYHFETEFSCNKKPWPLQYGTWRLILVAGKILALTIPLDLPAGKLLLIELSFRYTYIFGRF